MCYCSQEDMLWVSDPKALQYIYQTSGYNFPKQPERRILSRLIGDSGLTWAEGASAREHGAALGVAGVLSLTGADS